LVQMIQSGSSLNCVDNSGGRRLQCIHVFGASTIKYAGLGGLLKVVAKDARKVRSHKRKKTVVAGEKYRAVIVNSRYKSARRDGSYVQFASNAAVIMNENFRLLGKRIRSLVAKEIKQNVYKLRLVKTARYSRGVL